MLLSAVNKVYPYVGDSDCCLVTHQLPMRNFNPEGGKKELSLRRAPAEKQGGKGVTPGPAQAPSVAHEFESIHMTHARAVPYTGDCMRHPSFPKKLNPKKRKPLEKQFLPASGDVVDRSGLSIPCLQKTR